MVLQEWVEGSGGRLDNPDLNPRSRMMAFLARFWV